MFVVCSHHEVFTGNKRRSRPDPSQLSQHSTGSPCLEMVLRALLVICRSTRSPPSPQHNAELTKGTNNPLLFLPFVVFRVGCWFPAPPSGNPVGKTPPRRNRSTSEGVARSPQVLEAKTAGEEDLMIGAGKLYRFKMVHVGKGLSEGNRFIREDKL